MLPRYFVFNYWNLYLVADVFLDSIDYSGFLTTTDAVACSLPVVTLPGRFHRGRQTYGILRQLGVTDTVASSKAEYVDLAVRLGKDLDWRDEIKRKMAAGQESLFLDTRSVRTLEEFYASIAVQAVAAHDVQ
jgi:predicted O-linked N-acetylglucosamine transferase (SPINDLY family)